MRRMILSLLLASAAFAGPDNPGPPARNISALWSSQSVTTAGATTTAYYPVGLDQQVSIDCNIENAGTSETVTLTALFRFPGGNTVAYPVEAIPSEQYPWVQGLDPTSFLFEVYAPHGAERMYLHAITTDSTGVSITARAIGR